MNRTAAQSRKRQDARSIAAAALGLRNRVSQKLKPSPPPIDEIVRRLEPYCRKFGIVRLDVFGSVARGEARPGSDVDLIATFRKIPGLHYFSMEKEMGRRLGVPVDLLLAEDVTEMTNPHRKATIERDRRTIYAA